MLASVLIRLGRIWGDDALVERGAGGPATARPGDGARSRGPSPGRSARSTCTSPRRASSRSSATSARRSRAPRSPASSPGRSSPSGRPTRCRCSPGKGLVDGASGGVRLRAVRLPRARDAGRASSVARLPRMATTLVTGAEEVGWDLADLYASADDERIDADVSQAEADAAAFRDAAPRQGRRARRGRARRGGHRARADRVVGRPGADLRAPPLRDEHGRSGARRARRPSRREGGLPRDAAPLLPARVGCGRRRRGRGAPRRRGARRLAPPPARSAQVPPVSALGARGEDRHREDRLRASPPGRGSTRSSSARSGSRSTTRSSRSRSRCRGSTSTSASMRREAADAITEALGPGLRTRTYVFNTILQDKSIDDRLRGYPTWISSRNLSNETTDEAVEALVEAATSRYDVRAALLPPQGEAARDRPARALRPLRARLRGHGEDIVGRGAADRRRGVLRVLRRGRLDRLPLLRRLLDRRARPARQAHRRLLRDDRARRPPVHPHELHGRPALDPDARARARARAARRALAAARASSTRRRR